MDAPKEEQCMVKSVYSMMIFNDDEHGEIASYISNHNGRTIAGKEQKIVRERERKRE
jgi:hypothetical protein